MPTWLAVVIGALTGLTAICGLIGVAARFVLLPWLRENLVKPVAQTNHQVSVNHHSSENPTLLDRLDDIEQEVRGVRADHQQHILWHLER